MKIAYLITFYDEFDIVERNIKKIIETPGNYIGLAHSDNRGGDIELLKKIRLLSDSYEIMPDLSIAVPKYAYQAKTISRNFSSLFQRFYKDAKLSTLKYDFIVCLTGDTAIIETKTIEDMCIKMKASGKKAAVSQAIGQYFHSADDNMVTTFGGRFQHANITDFMPQFFIVDGKFAQETEVFDQIEVTNQWTSEQCLGDSLSKTLSKFNNNIAFHDNVLILNSYNPEDAYSYGGIQYHSKTKGAPGR